MLEDQRGLDTRDLVSFSERRQGQLAQVLRIAHRHVKQKVVFAGHVEGLMDFGKAQGVGSERFHGDARVPGELHGDQGLQTDAHALRLDVGMEAAKRARGVQPAHPFETGGGCDSQPLR